MTFVLFLGLSCLILKGVVFVIREVMRVSLEETAVSIRDWARKITNANGHIREIEKYLGHIREIEKYLREEELSEEEIAESERVIVHLRGAKQVAQERLRFHALQYIQKFLIEVGEDLLAEAENEKEFGAVERMAALLETVEDLFEIRDWFKSLESQDPT